MKTLMSRITCILGFTVFFTITLKSQEISVNPYLAVAPQFNTLTLNQTGFSSNAMFLFIPGTNLSLGVETEIKSFWFALGIETGLNTYNVEIRHYYNPRIQPISQQWNGIKTFTYTNFGPELQLAYKISSSFYLGSRLSVGLCTPISEATNSELNNNEYALYLNQAGRTEDYFSINLSAHKKIRNTKIGASIGHQKTRTSWSGYAGFSGLIYRLEYQISFN